MCEICGRLYCHSLCPSFRVRGKFAAMRYRVCSVCEETALVDDTPPSKSFICEDCQKHSLYGDNIYERSV